MADDAWRIGFSTNQHRPSQETRPAHETALLHEVIVQAVTDRKIDANPTIGYDEQLYKAVKHIEASTGYKTLLRRPNFSREDVTHLLDSQQLTRLPTYEAWNHVTLIMVTGGPATGKSGLLSQARESHPHEFANAAKINPDDYKPLLADPAIYGNHYADVAHEESSQLTGQIIGRLEEKIASGLSPHVVMDVVSANDRRLQFAHQTGKFYVITGTAPPEVTVERAFERGEKPGGRAVPTEIVLDGARKVAATTPNVFSHPGVSFELVDTNVPFGTPNTSVAHLETRGGKMTLSITDPNTFIDFVERQNLNSHAHNPSELFRPQDRTPAAIAQGLKAYTDKGVTLTFLDKHGDVAMTVGQDGVQQIKPLESQRGASFFPELVLASRVAVGSELSRTKPQEMDEHHTTPLAEGEGLPLPTRVGTISAGVGTAMGAKGIYDDLHGKDSRLKHDLHAGGAQAVVGGSRFLTQIADFTIGAAATIEGTRRALATGAEAVAGIAPQLAELGPAMRLAGRAAIPLAVAAGGLEATAGIIENNPKRVAAAIGSTSGGIGGGIIGGVLAGAAFGFVAGGAAGSETGPGALITGGIGALGGAIWGGMVGEDRAKKHLTGAVDTVMHMFDHHPASQHAEAPTPSTPTHLSPDMLRALGAAKGASLSTTIHHDSATGTQLYHGLHTTTKQPLQSVSVR